MDFSGEKKRAREPFLSFYFDSKFEIKTTVHKHAEWRKNLGAAR